MRSRGRWPVRLCAGKSPRTEGKWHEKVNEQDERRTQRQYEAFLQRNRLNYLWRAGDDWCAELNGSVMLGHTVR